LTITGLRGSGPVKHPLVEASVAKPAVPKKVRREMFIFMLAEKLAGNLENRALKKDCSSFI
jgi:hypothetical protein